MEIAEALFDVIDSLGTPMVLLESDRMGGWSPLYANEAMSALLGTAHGSDGETTAPDAEVSTETGQKNQNPQEKEAEPEQSATEQADPGETEQPPADQEIAEGSEEKAALNVERGGVQVVLNDELTTLLQDFGRLGVERHTFDGVEILGGIYSAHCIKNRQRLLLFLMPIEPEELFDHLSFHDLESSCSALVLVLDEEGKMADVNQCFCDLAGIKKSDCSGKEFFSNFIPGDIEKLQHYFEQILTGDEPPQHFVTPFRDMGGNSYRIYWQVSTLKRFGHTYVIAVGSDVTPFVEENSDLKHQLGSIRVGFDYFPFAVGYMNAEGEFTKMNQRFKNMFGIKEQYEKVRFDSIRLFKKHIGFEVMKTHIAFIKEMRYTLDTVVKGKPAKLRVDIRMLQGTKESAQFYIVVAQRLQ